ncbi:MAG: DUF2089 family protein [Phycisphaeraceae bacterium]|nr:DUF2089 family protein [Phycisphaerales bacterium]MCB9859668.1 DUF2089 family protein [Phycisphaeraceae bacterium]
MSNGHATALGGAGSSGALSPAQLAAHPLARLSMEDLDFIIQFVLCSGSLKDLAKSYSVSYPTIRTRLDQLITRVRDALDGKQPDPLAELVAGLVQRGELSTSSARRIIDLGAQLRAQSAG